MASQDRDVEAADASEVPTPVKHLRSLRSEDLDPDAVKVVRRLTQQGHLAYLVGGSVRDLLLGRAPKDFDVATSARPEEVRRIFRNCRIIGRRFRLAHVLYGGGKIIETATFRKDPSQRGEPQGDEADGGGVDEEADLLIRHDNVFGKPHEDAVRRDFTINGLSYDVNEHAVIDYVGGVPDVSARIVRTIGDPDVRLREDPIRILRAIKFSARLDLGIDPNLYDAMVRHRLELDRAARPRVLEEVLRLLRGGASQRSVYLLWDTGVLSIVLPELASFLDDQADPEGFLWKRLQRIDQLQATGQLPSDAVLIGCLLKGPLDEWLEGAPDPSVAFEEFFSEVVLRLAIPRRIKDRLRLMVMAQRRLATGKLGALPRRDFFHDAATLFSIHQGAAGRAVPAWAKEPPPLELPDATARRRRRRRR